MMNKPVGIKTDDIAGKRRINFPKPVKKLLNDEAGGVCCFDSCLRMTGGVTTNKSGTSKPAGIGVAAHVYSAAERGPRGRGGHAEEYIKSADNGLWMCASCGKLVDDFQSSYPADKLLRMKAVRALAHDITVHDPTINLFVNLVGIRPLNDLVANHVAELPVAFIKSADKAPIKEAFMSMAFQRLEAIDRSKTPGFPALPEKYVKTAIAHVLASMGVPPQTQTEPVIPMAIRTDGTSYSNKAQAAARSLAINMAASWWHSVKGELEPNKMLIVDSRALLAARNPHNGEIYNPGFVLSVTTQSLFHYSVEDGEHIKIRFRNGHNRKSEFHWQAAIDVQHDIHGFESTLSATIRSKDHFLDSYDPGEHEIHKELLAKLIAGWEPIIYYSFSTDSSEQDALAHLDPVPLRVKCNIPVDTLKDMLARCKKIDAAIAFQRRWNTAFPDCGNRFLCSNDYLSDQATPELMENAFEEMCAKARDNPYQPNLWKVGPLFMWNGRIGAFLEYRGGVLSLARRRVAEF